jgi:hypothetical protein
LPGASVQLPFEIVISVIFAVACLCGGFMIKRSIQLCQLMGLVLAATLTLSSCASNRTVNLAANPACGHIASFDHDLATVKAFFDQGKYAAAETVLKSMAAKEYSLSRMDELLQWMERCELCLTDPFKAHRLLADNGEKSAFPD